MIPPKYNFYIGKVNRNMYFNANTAIDNSGAFDYEADSDKYASYRSSAGIGKLIFIDLVSVNSYNAIFFYDDGQNFISYKTLSETNNIVISPPANAAYWAVRFTTDDANFMAKKETDFIYFIERAEPHFKDLSKKYAKESGQEFFRITLDGKINLFGNDYEIVKQSDLEDRLIFIIDKYSKTSYKWVEYYKGEFSKTDCKLDYAKKKCELKTTAIDGYNEIINKYEDTYDLVKLAPAISKINLHKRSLMQIYVRGASTITNLFGGTYWEADVNEAIDSSSALIDTYHFAYLKTCNEFYINNAGVSDVDGVYAGSNGTWGQSSGDYTLYKGGGSANTYDYIYIKRNSDNVNIYKSTIQYMFPYEGDNHINEDIDITMVNINNSSDTFTIDTIFVYRIFIRLLCDVDTVEDSTGVKNTYDLPSDDFVSDDRNYKKCIGLAQGLVFCTSVTVDESTKYGLNDYGQYFTNQFIPSSAGLGRALPISRNSWANASLWYAYDSLYETFEERLRKQYTLKDSYSVGAAIKALLKKIDPTLSHETTAEYSQFLYGGSKVLGLDRFSVHIAQKTNMLKGNYDQAAQKAEITLKDIMGMLSDCFRCYCYVEDNKFKIEHIYFFMNGGSYSTLPDCQLDFTQITDRYNKKPTAYFQSEVEFEKTDLNRRYEFAWMDDVTDLFGGVTIDVKSNYIQKDKTESISISQFSSDVDYMLFNPSNFSEDGFALLCPVKVSADKYDVADYYISYQGNMVHNSVEDNYKVVVYKINPYSKYRIKGAAYGVVSVGAFYSNVNNFTKRPTNDYYIDNIHPKTNADIINVDFVISAPSNAKYLAITQYNPLGDENPKVVSEDSAEYRLPIITVDNLIDGNGDTYKAIIQNWYASWIYLQNLYMWDMPAITLESNVTGNLQANDIRKCMTQTIEFLTEEDPNELELIKTSFGNGQIYEMSVNINTGQTKVNLLYTPQ